VASQNGRESEDRDAEHAGNMQNPCGSSITSHLTAMIVRFVSCVATILFSASIAADDQSSAAKQPNVEQSSVDAANQKFRALDRNHDQHISLEEARKDPELLKRFASADTNGDGKLDQAEFQSKPSERPAG